MENQNIENLKWFVELYITAQIVGILSIILVLYWCLNFAQGFGLSGSVLFNWHPLFMSIGMIYLMGNAILAFRAFRNTHKTTLKLIHATLNIAAFIFTLFATYAVFAFHNQLDTPNLYTLHSWIGLIAVLLSLVQITIGFSAYLYPTFSGALRSFLLPYHVYFGHLILGLSTVAAVSGLLEKAIFKLGQTYQQVPFEASVMNLAGVLLVVFTAIVMYLTTNVYYKRYPRPEDSELLEKTS